MNEYEVWCPDLGEDAEDAVIVSALDEEHVAKVWAERSDAYSSSYWIIGSTDGTVVHVRSPDGTTSKWRVTGLQTLVYRARTETYMYRQTPTVCAETEDMEKKV